MAAKDSRRVVALYNRVARALVEYEIVWHASWLCSIEAATAALNITLIYQDPHTGEGLNCSSVVVTLVAPKNLGMRWWSARLRSTPAGCAASLRPPPPSTTLKQLSSLSFWQCRQHKTEPHAFMAGDFYIIDGEQRLT